MKKCPVKAGLISGLMFLMPLTGCVPYEVPPVAEKPITATTLVSTVAMESTAPDETEITVTVSEPISEITSAVTTTASDTYTEPVMPPEPELSDDTFTITTASTDYVEIAGEVLEHIYSKSEKESQFEINDIRYMAKGMVGENLWFAVKFTVQTGEQSLRLEALIQQDSEQEYSLITINTNVPFDNLVDEENGPEPADAGFAEFLNPIQNTCLLAENWNIEAEMLPSPNNLVIFAQKNIGEKSSYTLEEIHAEVQKYLPVSMEYLKTSACYNPTADSFSLIENQNIWHYAAVSAEAKENIYYLTLVGSRSDDNRFTKEILLTLDGSPEQYRMISCEIKERQIPQPEVPAVLSHSQILLGENIVNLDLLLTDGQYIESVSENNIFRYGYRGKYDFVISDEGTELFRLPVSFPGLELLNYKEPFELAFSDYDKDGNFEISLGQWINGRMFYQFYSIGEDGSITLLPLTGEPILTNGAEYSRTFDEIENGFTATTYSEESGDFISVNYIVSPENIISVTE